MKYNGKILLIASMLLPACTSIQNRYQKQNLLVYQNATCKTDEPLDPDRKVFDLKGLSTNEAIETHCGPYCESGISNKYRIGMRTTDKELYLTNLTGTETIRLDFQTKKYKRLGFAPGGVATSETGSCEFNR